MLEPSTESLAVRIGDNDQNIQQADNGFILVGRKDFVNQDHRCSKEQLKFTVLSDPPKVETIGKNTSWIAGPGCSENEAKPLPTGAICTAQARGCVAASPPSRKVASSRWIAATRASPEHAWKSQSAGCTQWDEAVRVLSWRGKAATLAG